MFSLSMNVSGETGNGIIFTATLIRPGTAKCVPPPPLEYVREYD